MKLIIEILRSLKTNECVTNFSYGHRNSGKHRFRDFTTNSIKTGTIILVS